VVRSRVKALICNAVAVSAVVSFVAAPASAAKETPKATEIGVSPDTIRIAVVADVDNPFAPGLFQGVVDGVHGAVDYINSKAGGGGIAGRKLAVDFIDSKLNANAARNGVITACSQDLALVGTAALMLNSADDIVNCPDQAGKAVGLPDIGAVVGTVEGCASVAFPVNPPSVICDTLEQHPQTYQGNQGAYKHLVNSTKGGLHGAMVYSNDTKTAAAGGILITDAFVHAGAKADQTVGQSGRAPQSAYTPIVQKMKEDSSNLGFGAVSLGGAIEWRSEAKLQGISDDQVTWVVPSGGYDKSLRESADAMDGTYIVMNFLPFEEARTNAMLANFLKYVGRDKATGFSVYGFAAGLALKDALDDAVAKHGADGITRTSLLAGLGTLTAFDAGGIIGKNNLAEKVSSACTMLEQFTSGRFVRVWPKKGTFDCTPSNYIRLKEDLTG
jgi:Periplasmic binding protein